MQIYPRASCCAVVSRLLCLYETSDDALRHACACTIEDCLVECETDGLAERCDQFCGEVDVAVFEIRITDCEETADFPAVEFFIVECKIQVVDVCAAVCPYCFGNCSHYNDAAFAVDLLYCNVLVQLGVFFDVLTNESEENFRNRQADVLERTLFTDAGADLAEVVLHIFACKKGIPFIGCHVEETLHHCVICPPFVSFFCRLLFRRSLFRDLLLGFFFCEFCLKSCDRLFEFGFCLVVFGLLCLELLDLFFDCGSFFVRFCLFDRFLELSLAFLEQFVFFNERCQVFLCSVNLLPEHQSFECHSGLLSVVLRPCDLSTPGVISF